MADTDRADSIKLEKKMAQMKMRDFLESAPPGIQRQIIDLVVKRAGFSANFIHTPNLTLHCESENCKGVRTFASNNEYDYKVSGANIFLRYICQNCKSNIKTFAISLFGDEATKFGEIPSFGPPTPSRALTLIGGDRDLFLKGRRCELQGLGIGAFTYYRRVIEDQRNRIFDEMIRVLSATHPGNEIIDELKSAKTEQQFTKSIEAIKHAIPDSLLINGQNPLRLLHSALSEGVHALSDQECLELATAVRTVLFEFSDRLADALRNDAELSNAVALLNKSRK